MDQGIIPVESRGNGMAVSPKGALGSTQLMPATAQEMAGKLGLPWRPDMLKSNDPAAKSYQRALGMGYLMEGYNKTGNMFDALRYYNGGPNFAKIPATADYANHVMSKAGML